MGRLSLRSAHLPAAGAVLLLLCLGSAPLGAQWRVEGWFGTAFNANTPVTFSQAGEPDIRVTGHWSTRAWQPTWYYSMRISRWSGQSAWAFEYMHHKIYMDNPPPEVDYFQITNGINNLLAERLWRRSGWEFGVGAGPAFLVPRSRVRGLNYNHGAGLWESRYELGGETVQLNLARRVKLVPHLYASLSVKGTASHLDANISGGDATLMNYALHLQYGLSLQ